MTDRRRTALHEAGHAVADVVLGRPVEYVSIRQGRTFRGIAVTVQRELADVDEFDAFRPVALQSPSLRADVERQVIAMLAGDIAALFLGPKPDTGYRDVPEADAIAREALATLESRLSELVVAHEDSNEPHAGDEANAGEFANAFAGPDAGAMYLEWLRAEARELIQRYAAPILRVADALERHTVLRSEQVAALVYPASRRRATFATKADIAELPVLQHREGAAAAANLYIGDDLPRRCQL